jgi:hypothetical protein
MSISSDLGSRLILYSGAKVCRQLGAIDPHRSYALIDLRFGQSSDRTYPNSGPIEASMFPFQSRD